MGGFFVRSFGTGFVALAICLSLPLAGQTLLDRDRDPALDGTQRVLADLSNASLRYGRVYLLSRFEVSDVAIDPGFTGTKDLKLSIVGSLPLRAYYVPSKKFAISADLTPSLALIDESGKFRTQAGYATRGDIHFLTNHFYGDVYAASADELVPLPREIRGIGTARNHKFGADGEVKYSSKTSLLLTASRSSVRYPGGRFQPDPELFNVRGYDQDEDRYRATVLHKTLPRISLTGSAEARRYEFPSAQYTSARRSELTAGATYMRRQQSYRIEAGPAKLAFNDPRFSDFSGVLARVTASVPVGRRWIFDGLASRDLGFSTYERNGYYTIDGASLGANWMVTRRFSLRASPGAWRHSYDTPVGGILRRDNYRQVLVGWTYAMPLLHFGFDVADYAYSSNVVTENDSGIRVILHLSFSSTRWFK